MKVRECMELLCRFRDSKQLKLYFTDDDSDITYCNERNFEAYCFGFCIELCVKSQIEFISEALLEQEVFKIYALETDSFAIRLKSKETSSEHEKIQEIITSEALPF